MRHLLLVCVASALLAGADAAPTVITVDQLPAALRGRLSQEIAGGTIVDIHVDERSGDPQYLVRYRNQGSTALQTLRLGQSGKVLDSGLIASPDQPDGSIGTSGGATPQTLPSRPSDGPTPVVPPQTNRPANGGTATPGFQQRAPGEAPADSTTPPASGEAPQNQNSVPGVMRQERQTQRENPPLPTDGSQPRNRLNQETDQPRKEDPPLPAEGSQPKPSQSTPGKSPSGGTSTPGGGTSH